MVFFNEINFFFLKAKLSCFGHLTAMNLNFYSDDIISELELCKHKNLCII